MMGGCWDRVQIPKFPALYPLAVAMRVRFPDNDPRDDHSVEVTIREGDSEPSVTFGYQLVRQSAPIGGLPLVAVFALPMIATMNTPGRYVVEAKIDTSERAAMDFLVEQSPASS